LKMQQDIRTLKQKCNAAMIALCPSQSLVKFCQHTPEKAVSCAPPSKIARHKRAKSSITQPWIIRFRWNFIQSLNTGQPKCCKSSRSRSERSRPQRYITFQKIAKSSIVQPWIARFRSNFIQTLITRHWCTTNFQSQRIKGQGRSVT